MSYRLLSVAALGLLTIIARPSLHAQEDSIHAWHFRADLGLVNTAGNTSTTTLNSSETASYLTGAWTFTQQGSALYGESDGKKSAESYLVPIGIISRDATLATHLSASV